jgi:hypothetical protein
MMSKPSRSKANSHAYRGTNTAKQNILGGDFHNEFNIPESFASNKRASLLQDQANTQQGRLESKTALLRVGDKEFGTK